MPRLFTEANRAESLASTHPDVAAEWHPTRNGALTAGQVGPGTKRSIWWKCMKHGHEWETAPNNRTKGNGCPYCGNRRVLPGFNDLTTTHPHIAQEWHPDKNGGLVPGEVVAGTAKSAWWKCERGHEWRAAVNNRTRQGTGCPYCSNRLVLRGYNDLATTHPEIAQEWHPERNGSKTPSSVVGGAATKCWWRCAQGHSWATPVVNRTLGKGCSRCAEQTSSLAERMVVALASELGHFEVEHLIDVQWVPTRPSLGARVDGYGRVGGMGVVFEYDGFRHANREERDLRKTRALLGSRDVALVVRVRTDSIGPLKDDDPAHLQFIHPRNTDAVDLVPTIVAAIQEALEGDHLGMERRSLQDSVSAA